MVSKGLAVAGLMVGSVVLCVPAASAAGGNGASYCSNAAKPDGVVDVGAVQSGDISSVDTPGEFVAYLAPLPGDRGSGWGFQNICNPKRQT